MLAGYAASLKMDVAGCGPHALRATAATNALDHEVDIAKVQEWLGHANISTTRIYDRRKMRAEDRPTFRSRISFATQSSESKEAHRSGLLRKCVIHDC